MASDLQAPRGAKTGFASQQQPCLLISNREHCHIQNNNMFNKRPLIYDVGGKIPEFLGRKIACSCREWVLLIGSYGDGVLVNLLSKETIELPLLNFKYEFCYITSPPSDPTCHIVFFNRIEYSLIICQPGDKEFTIRKWDFQVFPDSVGAVVGGKLFLDIRSLAQNIIALVMVEFKESKYQFKVVEMDRSEIQFHPPWDYYLFEYSGELFILYKIMCAYQYRKVAAFKILKADFLNKKWVRIENLGRLAIFISYKTGHAHCVAAAVDDSGIQATSIYFLEQYDVDRYYVYNLEEGTVRMKPVFSSMRDRKKRLDWIVMPHSPSFSKLLKGDAESVHHDSEKEQNEVQESWNIVPPELLNLIQLRLFGKDYAMFRGVCKAWYQASIRDYSTPSLLSLETLLLEQCHSSSPLLMSQEDITTSSVPIFRFFDPIYRKLYRTIIPELREVDIHCSRDGWLLVRRSVDESLFFLNPLTQEKIELPRMAPHTSTHDFSFSSPPTCSNCLVTAMSYGRLYTLKHGDRTWREHSSFCGLEGEYLCNNVVLNGLHYFVSEHRSMIVFNFKNGAAGQKIDWQSWSSKFRRSSAEDFLVEIDGGPALISVEPNQGKISIFKWNDLEKDWELMEGGDEFGGRVMFFSNRCSFMVKSDDVGGMRNTIFLPMVEDAKFGVFYSLATGKYHTFYSDYSSKLPYHVDKFQDGIWVQPDRNIVGHDNLKWLQLPSPPKAVINGCRWWTRLLK